MHKPALIFHLPILLGLFLAVFAGSAGLLGMDQDITWGPTRLALFSAGLLIFVLFSVFLVKKGGVRLFLKDFSRILSLAIFLFTLLVIVLYMTVASRPKFGLLWTHLRQNPEKISVFSGYIYSFPLQVKNVSDPESVRLEFQQNNQALKFTSDFNPAQPDLKQGSFALYGGTIYFFPYDLNDPTSIKNVYSIYYSPVLVAGKYLAGLYLLLLFSGLFAFSYYSRFYPEFGSTASRWKHYLNKGFLALACLNFAALLYALLIPSLSLSFIHSPFFILYLFFLLVLLCRLENRLAKWLTPLLLISLFCLPVIAMWQGERSGFFAVGGLLPSSDAKAFYLDSLRLLKGFQIYYSVWVSRQVPALIWSFFLWVFQHNLQLVLVTLAGLVGSACYLFLREIQKSFGSLAACFSVVSIFTYFNLYFNAGTLMSENIGLLLGLPGITLYLAGIRVRNHKYLFCGLASITLALLARPGLLPVLFLLLAGALFLFQNWIKRIKYFSISLGVLLAVFFINNILGQAFGTNPAVNNSGTFEISKIIWGLAVGRNPQDIVQKFPNLSADRSAEDASFVLANAKKTFLANPQPALANLKTIYKNFFTSDENVICQFSEYPALKIAGFLLSILGIIALLTGFRSPSSATLLFTAAGVFVMLPFIYYIPCRLIAPLYPLMSLLGAVGLQSIDRIASLLASGRNSAVSWKVFILDLFPPRAFPGTDQNHDVHAQWAARAALCFLAIILLFSLLLVFWQKSPRNQTNTPGAVCPQDSIALFKPEHGAYLLLTANEGKQINRVPRVDAALFHKNLGIVSLNSLLETLPGQVIYYDEDSRSLVVIPEKVLSLPDNSAFCGQPSKVLKNKSSVLFISGILYPP